MTTRWQGFVNVCNTCNRQATWPYCQHKTDDGRWCRSAFVREVDAPADRITEGAYTVGWSATGVVLGVTMGWWALLACLVLGLILAFGWRRYAA